MTTIHTIGFTKKSAEQFFSRLKMAGVRMVVDTRLHNTSQLSGFAKADDLRYFLRELRVAEYVHLPSLAPSEQVLDGYRKGKLTWVEYERQYLSLIESRRAEDLLDRNHANGICLLCSEDKPHHCHRRLLAEYLQRHWGDEVRINHIV